MHKLHCEYGKQNQRELTDAAWVKLYRDIFGSSVGNEQNLFGEEQNSSIYGVINFLPNVCYKAQKLYF